MKPFVQDKYSMDPDAKTLQMAEIQMYNVSSQQSALRQQANAALTSLNALKIGIL